MDPRRVSYQDLPKAGKNGKGGAGYKGLIFLLTTNQREEDIVCISKRSSYL
jgi:hypothetical protein